MRWLSVLNDGMPDEGQRVLTYSGIYKDVSVMKYRIMDGKFVRICKEVTYYDY